jgi:L,D-transpeptidase ErfK/SrfK
VFALLAGLATSARASDAGVFSNAVMGGVSDYIAQRGDTLAKLSARYGISRSVLAHDNRKHPLRAGSVVHLDTRHIVPQWLDDGIVINLPQRTLFFFQDKQLVASYPVGVGKPDWPTPTGSFKIHDMQTDKAWLVPLSIQEEMRREGQTVITRVPPGPNNPLGRHWLGLSIAGYGIHGTSSPTSLYQFRSHGCIRSHPDDIEVLAPLVHTGTKVIITYYTTLLAQTADGRIWLEVQPDAYKKGNDALTELRELAQKNNLVSKIDWDKAYRVIQKAQGVAREIGLPS